MSDPLTAKAVRVEQALSAEYGRPVWSGPGDILDEVVLTILSQNTSDVNSGRAFEQLRHRFPTMDDVLNASEEALEDAIRPAGLARQKAPRIRVVLQDARERFGCASLEALWDWDTEAIRGYLRSFPGVGPKTVACALLFAMGRPTMPVDTHVGRVAKRLGLVPETASSEEAHATMDRITPPEIVYQLHVDLIRHGRAICRPTNPRCLECVVRDECDWYRRMAEVPVVPARRKPSAAPRAMKATRERRKGAE